MRFSTRQQQKTPVAFYLHCGALLLLSLFSVLVVACSSGGGGTNANTPNIDNPPVTVTIQLGHGGNASPTPQLPAYSCGAWATQTSPPYGTASVAVYGKFTHTVDMNPQGIGGAAATATVSWPDGTVSQETVSTTSDGLAVFSINTAGRAADVNKITLVTVTFAKDGVPNCTADGDRSAFFTLVSGPPPKQH